MSTPTVVSSALLAPGVCTLSGDFNGPFIDTGKSVRGHGRIYLSLKALAPFVRAAGWLPGDEVAALRERAELLDAADGETHEQASRYRAIVDVLEPLLPPSPERVREVAVFQDEDVRRTNVSLQAANEELQRLVLDLVEDLAASQAATPEPGAAPAGTGSSTDAEAPGSSTSDEVDLCSSPPETVEVAGQDVDLDALLDRSADDIVSVVTDWPREAVNVLLAREEHRRGKVRVVLADKLAV